MDFAIILCRSDTNTNSLTTPMVAYNLLMDHVHKSPFFLSLDLKASEYIFLLASTNTATSITPLYFLLQCSTTTITSRMYFRKHFMTTSNVIYMYLKWSFDSVSNSY